MNMQTLKYSASAALALIAIFALSGCYVTAPYFGQKFDNRSSQVPFQVYTTHLNNPVKIQCANASAHGWAVGSYTTIATVYPQSQGLLDTKGAKVYSASKKMAIPDSCWSSYGYSDTAYITNVRVTQVQPGLSGGTAVVEFKGFDLDGLECLGQKTGAAGNWFSGFNKCEKRFSGADGSIIPYQVLYATDP